MIDPEESWTFVSNSCFVCLVFFASKLKTNRGDGGTGGKRDQIGSVIGSLGRQARDVIIQVAAAAAAAAVNNQLKRQVQARSNDNLETTVTSQAHLEYINKKNSIFQLTFGLGVAYSKKNLTSKRDWCKF